MIGMKKHGFIESFGALIKSRKEVVFGVTWTTALSTIIAGRGFPSITKSFVSILAIAMLSLSVYIYNDIIDRQMDAYSNQDKKKGRPIAHGLVSIKHAQNFVLVTALLGLGMCMYLGRTVFAIGSSFYVIFYLYSYPMVRLKTKFIIKNVVTSLILPVAFLIGGVSINGILTMSNMFLSFAYFMFLFFILPAGADWLDYEEDKAFNIKTIGNSYSWKTNVRLFNLGILIFIISTAILYRVWDYSIVSLLLVTGFGLPVMAYSAKLSNENGITASYKLRPVGYAYLLATPFLIAIGTLF
jgi:4-hydroxybenzoate polyprenyltransferase